MIFLISLQAIVYATIYGRNENTELVLIPFISFIHAKTNKEMYRSMLMNVFLFVPLGLSFPVIIPKKYKPMLLTAVTGFILSAVIEFLQYNLSLGRSEIDDVIMNTLGTIIGSLGYLLVNKRR